MAPKSPSSHSASEGGFGYALSEKTSETDDQRIQDVTPDDVRRIFADQVHPDQMTILVVGDPDRIGRDTLAGLGPVTVLQVD